VNEIPEELAREGFTDKEARAIEAALASEERWPPTIALVGETGVGKSSTLNALFGCAPRGP
jgi:predicted GTPase